MKNVKDGVIGRAKSVHHEIVNPAVTLEEAKRRFDQDMKVDPVWQPWMTKRGHLVVDFYNRTTGSVDFRTHITDCSDLFELVDD